MTSTILSVRETVSKHVTVEFELDGEKVTTEIAVGNPNEAELKNTLANTYVCLKRAKAWDTVKADVMFKSEGSLEAAPETLAASFDESKIGELHAEFLKGLEGADVSLVVTK